MMKCKTLITLLAAVSVLALYFLRAGSAGRSSGIDRADGLYPANQAQTGEVVVNGSAALGPAAGLRSTIEVVPPVALNSSDSLVGSELSDENVENSKGLDSQPGSGGGDSYLDELRTKYEAMNAIELFKAHQEVTERLGKMHIATAQAMIKEGRGDIVPQSEFSFRGNEDPDVLTGGYFDGETYYKVKVERIDDLELFLVRDELQVLTSIINARGGRFESVQK